MSFFKSVMAFIGGGVEENRGSYSYLDDDYFDRIDHREKGQDVEPVLEDRETNLQAPKPRKRPRAVTEDLESTGSTSYDTRAISLDDPKPVSRRVKPIDEPKPLNNPEQILKSNEIPIILKPKSFGDAKDLADEFSLGLPVVMNLRGLDRDLSRRLIDFASGICYALSGGMEKIAPHVFLLTPDKVSISADIRSQLDRTLSALK
jgi:cell division inhibitor SepF